MKEYQKRVIFENGDLKDKIDKLSLFTRIKIFNSLPEDEQVRLKKQLSLMKEYSSVLSERINLFEP